MDKEVFLPSFELKLMSNSKKKNKMLIENGLLSNYTTIVDKFYQNPLVAMLSTEDDGITIDNEVFDYETLK